MGMVDRLGLGMYLRWQNQMTSETKKAERDLDGVKKSAIGLSDSLEKQSERARRAAERYRKGMMISMRVAAGGVVMALPFILAGKAAATSQQSLADVNSLLVGTGTAAGIAEQQIAGLSNAILGQTGRVMVSLEDTEAASYKLVSALGAVQGAAAITPAANLAVAGLGSMEESVTFLTSLLATYGEAWGDTLTPTEKAMKVANIAAGTIAGFNTNLTDLGAAMTYVAGQGSVMGVSLAELSVTLGALQTKGLQKTLAGTALGSYLRRVAQVERFLKRAGKTGAVLKGLTIKDAAGQLLPLPDILEQIEKKFGVTGDAAEAAQKRMAGSAIQGADAFEMLGISTDNAAALSRVFGDEGSRVIAMLLGQSDALRTQIKDVQKSSALMEMVAARTETASAEYFMFKESLKGFGSVLGAGLLPAFTSFVGVLRSSVLWLKEFALNHPTATKFVAFAGLAVGSLAAVTGAVGTVVFALKLLQAQMVIASLAKQALAAEAGVTALGSASLVASAKMWLATAATKAYAAAQWIANIAAMAFPFVAIAVGVTALIALVVDMINHWERYASTFSAVGAGIVTGVQELAGFFVWFADKAWWAITWPFIKGYDLIVGVMDSIKRAWNAGWMWITDMTARAVDNIMLLPGIRALVGLWDMGAGAIKMMEGDFTGGLSQSMKGLFRTADFTGLAEGAAALSGFSVGNAINDLAVGMTGSPAPAAATVGGYAPIPQYVIEQPQFPTAAPRQRRPEQAAGATTNDYSTRRVMIDVHPAAGTDERKIAEGVQELERLATRRSAEGTT